MKKSFAMIGIRIIEWMPKTKYRESRTLGLWEKDSPLAD
jgi:hypothetical protein